MSFQFDPGPAPLGGTKARVVVFRVGGADGSALLSNVRCLKVEAHEGAHPGVAHFRYAFDPTVDNTPVRLEDVFPITAYSPAVCKVGDRIAVAWIDPNDETRYLFDGHVQAPQGELAASPGGRGGHELVTFQALGVAQVGWDRLFDGTLLQPADDDDATPRLVKVPARFNPDGLPNAAPSDDFDVSSGGFKYPPFYDAPTIKARAVGKPVAGVFKDKFEVACGRLWTLEMAARYVIGKGNVDTELIRLPSWQSVAALLVAQEPNGSAYDPDDPSTYDVKPIFVRDFHLHGKAWPDALHELIAPHGFAMRFVLEGASGLPQTRLVLWRRLGGKSRRKSLYLQAPADDLDPGASNLSAMRAQRDSTKIANVVRVESGLERWEASFVLAPGFEIDTDDVANKANYVKGDGVASATFKDNIDKYRAFVFDETGDGHWDFQAADWTTDAGDLRPLLGDPADDVAPWVARRRPPLGTLLTKGADKQPLRATLAISYDYAGAMPGVWDGSGTWRTIKGEWSLMPDRIGIRIGAKDPNAFHIGGTGTEGGKKAAPAIRLVEWLAGTPQTKVWLRLTCVVEGDARLDATADRSAANPLDHDVERTIDAKDRFRFEGVHESSEHSGGQTKATRDDTAAALAEAYARKRITEIPPLAGTVTIPKLSLAYDVGDQVVEIRGRDASLQTNVGTGTGEAPTYPEVVGRDWTFDGDQSTVLHLDDRRAEIVRGHH